MNDPTIHNSSKKIYEAPLLVQQAHLRDITLGSSPGSGESFPGDFGGGGSPDQRDGRKSSGGIFENDIFGG